MERNKFPQKFKVIGLAAGDNTDLLAEQAVKHSPEIVSVKSESNAEVLASKIKNSKTQIVYGEEGAEEVASIPLGPVI